MTSLLTLQFLKKEGLAATPLSIQADTDRRLHGGLAQDVCQGAAVQVVTQHVSVRLGGREVLWGGRKRKGLERVFSLSCVTALICRKENKKLVLAPNICVRMLFWWVQSMLYGVSPALLGR